MLDVGRKEGTRAAQRLETRERIFDAAVSEYARIGMAEADIGEIVTAAGVARGTFYFHFPTKEHVLAELEHREQVRLTSELRKFLRTPHDLRAALREIVRLVVALDRRLGSILFRDLLALHFSASRPVSDEWSNYEIIVFVVDEIERAQEDGEVDPDVDARHTAFFFLIGLYALLVTSHGFSKAERATMLDNFVHTVLSGLEAR